MVRLYARLVEEGIRRIEEIPEKYRAEVQQIISKEEAI